MLKGMSLRSISVALLLLPASTFVLSPSHNSLNLASRSLERNQLRIVSVANQCRVRGAVDMLRPRMTAATTLPIIDVSSHVNFLSDVAGTSQPDYFGQKLQLLVSVMVESRKHEVLAPTDRRGVHPLVIPLLRDSLDGSVIGLLLQPQSSQTELPVVRTDKKSMRLLGSSVDLLVKRLAIEEDYRETPFAGDILKIARTCGMELVPGAPREEKNKKLGLERFLLTRVGAFPDLYEWLSGDWLSKGKVEEALISCARASGLIPDWGRSHWVHSQLLHKLGGRELEARDCARAAMQLPLWTLGGEVAEVVARAESRMETVQKAYLKWALVGGPEEDFVNTGKSATQVALGRASYLLDTVVLMEERSWDGVKLELADLYDAAGLPHLARFVRAGI